MWSNSAAVWVYIHTHMYLQCFRGYGKTPSQRPDWLGDKCIYINQLQSLLWGCMHRKFMLFSVILHCSRNRGKKRCSPSMTSQPEVKLFQSVCQSWGHKDLWTGWGGKGSQKGCRSPTSPLAVQILRHVPWLFLPSLLVHITVVSSHKWCLFYKLV